MSSTGSARFGRLRAALPVALVAGLLLGGCTPGAEEAPLRIDAIDGSEPLDTLGGVPVTAAIVAESVHAGLTARDPAGKVVPGLAQSWRVSADGLSIVFRLRPAQFADGRPVEAADVVASLDAARRGRRTAEARLLMQGVRSVASPLEDIVEVRLTTPQPELLELLATPWLHVRPRRGAAVGAGPFVAVPEADAPTADRWLHRNPRFYASDSVGIDRSVVRNARSDEAIRRFAGGETDIVTGALLDGLGPARILPRRDALRLEVMRAGLLLLVNQDRPPLDNLRVRSAIAMAIDRDGLGPMLFGSPAAAAMPGIVPPDLSALGLTGLPDWAGLPMDARRAEAARRLAEAGITPASRVTLPVAVGGAAADARLMEAVARDLAPLGIDLRLERRVGGGHAAAVQRGDFALALATRTASVASPIPFLAPFRCGQNRFGACIPEADRLLAESWKAPTAAERQALIAAAERLWTDDGVAIGLVRPVGWSLVAPRVGGFAATGGGLPLLRHLSLTDRRSRA